METIKESLHYLGCETESVYYCNPRGFANESVTMPIPAGALESAAALVAVREVAGDHYVRLMPVDDLTASQAHQIRLWTSPCQDGATLIKENWDEATNYLIDFH